MYPEVPSNSVTPMSPTNHIKRLWAQLFQSVAERPTLPVAAASSTSDAPGVDPRIVGLIDAVRAGWYLQPSDELLQGFQISSQDTVLDVGCGDGMATIFAAQRGASVIFADVSAQAIAALAARVQQTPARQSRGLVTDSSPLPLDDAIATRVIAMEVLEHVEDPQRVMRELARVAAPGALFLLTVPDEASERLLQTVAPASYFSAPNHIRIFSANDFEQLVTDTGLTIVRQHSYSFYWNMAMALFWLSDKETDRPEGAASASFLVPPFPQIMDQWATVWKYVVDHPHGEKLRAHLDKTMPRSRIIIAQKPN